MANTYDILGTYQFDKAVDWLDQHCEANRETSFVNAAAELTVNLFPTRRNLAPGKDNRVKWAGQGGAVEPAN